MSAEESEQVQPCFAIDEDLRKDLEEAFKSADTNGDHTIDRKEFMVAMDGHIKKKVAKYIFDAVDQSGDGKITLDEFNKFMLACIAVDSANNFVELFRLEFDACDKGKKGYLTMKEFVRFAKMNNVSINFFNKKKQFKAFDANGDGKIDWEEVQRVAAILQQTGGKF